MKEFLFLILIVIANFIILKFGKTGVYINALLILPLDILLRDFIHEDWKNKSNFWVRFIFLFLMGGALTYFINADALLIAIASSISFICSNLIDTVIYSKLQGQSKFVKMTVSNFFSVAADTFIFIGIVFGFNYSLMGVQFILKFLVTLIFVTIYVKHNN